MLKFIATAIFALALSSARADILEPWAGFSSPEIMGSGFTHNYFSLPAEGATNYGGPYFWSGDYWPSKLGGINYRWNSSRPSGFRTYNFPRNEVLRLDQKTMRALAPSEKYDILMGRYDYPLKAEVAKGVNPNAQDWEGICHGWVLASLHHAEPTPKTLVNRDGVRVSFGSSDIKALLTYFYAWYGEQYTSTVGKRCSFGNWTGGREGCDQDLNAGAFHIIIANKLGLQGKGLIMDVEHKDEVWNQPVVAYRSQFLGEYRPTAGAARSTVREIRLTTQVWYVNETDNSWNPVHGTSLQKLDTRTFQYRVEINNRDEIVGGTWESEERPDFLWHKEKARGFGGFFTGLPQLLND